MALQIIRPQLPALLERLGAPRRAIQVVAGPRQVGKTTLVRQAMQQLQKQDASAIAIHSVMADAAGAGSGVWLAAQWEVARALCQRLSTQASGSPPGRVMLVIDEVQKIPKWTEWLKRLWDEDTEAQRPLHVVVLGSAPLLMAKGLTESLAGRFEVLRMGHWRYAEVREAFDLTPDEFIFFGAYPGAMDLIRQPERWGAYVRDALIDATISRDVLQMHAVQKPALMHRLVDLACNYSGRILSYQKMLGQLDDAGNTVTLAHYLHLLEASGMVTGLPKYTGQVLRQRASSPKLQVFNQALLGANAVSQGMDIQQLKSNPTVWGRWVESAVGAELLARHLEHSYLRPQIFYWNEGDLEVDFVVQDTRQLWAMEVKSASGSAPIGSMKGLQSFVAKYPQARPMMVGGGGMAVGLWLG